MKYLIFIFCIFFSIFSFAKTKSFEMQVNQVSINDSLDIQTKKLKVQPNQSVIISRSFDASGVNTVVEMKVTDDNSKIKDGILISLSIVEEKDGKKTVVGTPQMIVKSGEEAEITQGHEGETPFFKVSLVGKRVH